MTPEASGRGGAPPPSSSGAETDVGKEPTARSGHRRRLLLPAALAAVLVLATLFVPDGWSPPHHRVTSIAVLPLENLSGDPAQEYFADGMTDAQLIHAATPDHYQAHWFLCHTYAANGQFEEAIVAAEKAVALGGRAPGALGILGLVYGLGGRRADAIDVRDELLSLHERRYVTPAALVVVFVGLGDRNQAFAWLERAYEERSNFMAYLNVFPPLDPLRQDPRFTKLLRRVGLPE